MRNYSTSKTATAELGRARLACSSINTCAASRDPISAASCCKLRLKLLLMDQLPTGKEDLKADRRVRHYKEVGLQEWPLAGRATIPRVLYGISLCMSLRRRSILSKSLRAPAPVDHTFRTVDRTAGRRFAVVARFGKRWEFGDNREVWEAFVCQYAPPRSCCSWGPAEAKRCMPATSPHGQCDGDVIDAEFALRRCHLSSTERIFLFYFALFAKNVAIDLKCIENHGGKPW